MKKKSEEKISYQRKKIRSRVTEPFLDWREVELAGPLKGSCLTVLACLLAQSISLGKRTFRANPNVAPGLSADAYHRSLRKLEEANALQILERLPGRLFKVRLIDL